jgi:hypothetical protein
MPAPGAHHELFYECSVGYAVDAWRWTHNMTAMDLEIPKEARPVARVLLLGPGERLLLLLAQDVPGGHQWWVTPGGGLDEGESFEQAARRELLEETGIQAEIGPWCGPGVTPTLSMDNGAINTSGSLWPGRAKLVSSLTGKIAMCGHTAGGRCRNSPSRLMTSRRAVCLSCGRASPVATIPNAL